MKREVFSHNPFMLGYGGDMFSHDRELGHKFPLGRLVGHYRFVSFEALTRRLTGNERIILNMGDSATSGFHSDHVYRGCRDPNEAFFEYKTYSDILREQSESVVINAGVPGYTSLQGKRYFERLLGKLSKRGLKVDVATFYFGNNDSTYNKHEDAVFMGDKPKSGEICRLNIQDYEQNMRDMVNIARNHDIQPILIMPIINYDWKPGLRSSAFPGEFDDAFDSLNDDMVKHLLSRALELYHNGEFEDASEMDYVLPRIKKRYKETLRKVAEETNTPLINVQSHLPESGCFVDYCHPLEPANQLIVEKIMDISDIEKADKRHIEDPEELLRNSMLAMGMKGMILVRRFYRWIKGEKPNIYPFY